MQQVAKAIERVTALDATQRVHRRRDIEDKFAPAGGLEVEHRSQLLAPKQQVVGEQIAVDYALGQLAFEIARQVLDLVFERPRDFAKIIRQPIAHRQVQVRDALEAEAVIDTLLVAFSNYMQLAERAADRLQLTRPQPRHD